MNKHFLRWIALLIIPCLVADPVCASALQNAFVRPVLLQQNDLTSRFQDQAVVGALVAAVFFVSFNHFLTAHVQAAARDVDIHFISATGIRDWVNDYAGITSLVAVGLILLFISSLLKIFSSKVPDRYFDRARAESRSRGNGLFVYLLIGLLSAYLIMNYTYPTLVPAGFDRLRGSLSGTMRAMVDTVKSHVPLIISGISSVLSYSLGLMNWAIKASIKAAAHYLSTFNRAGWIFIFTQALALPVLARNSSKEYASPLHTVAAVLVFLGVPLTLFVSGSPWSSAGGTFSTVFWAVLYGISTWLAIVIAKRKWQELDHSPRSSTVFWAAQRLSLALVLWVALTTSVLWNRTHLTSRASETKIETAAPTLSVPAPTPAHQSPAVLGPIQVPTPVPNPRVEKLNKNGEVEGLPPQEQIAKSETSDEPEKAPSPPRTFEATPLRQQSGTSPAPPREPAPPGQVKAQEPLPTFELSITRSKVDYEAIGGPLRAAHATGSSQYQLNGLDLDGTDLVEVRVRSGQNNAAPYMLITRSNGGILKISYNTSSTIYDIDVRGLKGTISLLGTIVGPVPKNDLVVAVQKYRAVQKPGASLRNPINGLNLWQNLSLAILAFFGWGPKLRARISPFTTLSAA